MIAMMVSAQVSGLQEYVRNHCRLAKLFEQKVLTDPRFQVLFKCTSQLNNFVGFFWNPRRSFLLGYSSSLSRKFLTLLEQESL